MCYTPSLHETRIWCKMGGRVGSVFSPWQEDWNVAERNYTPEGMRLTDCCGAYSTYMDSDYPGARTLCCKVCFHEVPFGQGDGAEFKPAAKYPQHILRDMHRDMTPEEEEVYVRNRRARE